jgi:hypothetical protein
MDTGIFVPILAFGTLGAVVVFAWMSKVKTDRRRESDRAKSTLAPDGPDRIRDGATSSDR